MPIFFNMGQPTPHRLGDGTKSSPAYSFSLDGDTGMYRAGSGIVIFSMDNTDIMRIQIGAVNVRSSDQIRWAAVSALDTTDTGIVRSSAAILRISNGSTGNGSIRVASGSDTTPSFSFEDDNDTGIWNSVANGVGIGTAASEKMRITTEVGISSNLIIGAAIGTSADSTLDVRGEISIFGSTASLSRIRFRGFYTASPSNPPNDQADMMIIDTGAATLFRIRYNDAGVMKVGDVALV